MIEMRLSLLLVLVPSVALADASTPDKRPPPTSFTVGDRAVTVGWGDDGEIHVRVSGGGDLVLKPAGRGYVAEDGLRFHAELAANVAPVPADPPSMSSSTVKFAGDTAVVTTRTAEDETHTRTKRTRYRWN